MLVHNARLAEKECGIPRKNIFVCDAGDIIEIDIPNRKLNVKLSDEEIARRKAAKAPYKPNVKGYLRKYAMHVSSAAEGAIELYDEE